MLTIILPFALYPRVKLQGLTTGVFPGGETRVQRFNYGYSVILNDFSGNLSAAQVALKDLIEDEAHKARRVNLNWEWGVLIFLLSLLILQFRPTGHLCQM